MTNIFKKIFAMFLLGLFALSPVYAAVEPFVRDIGGPFGSESGIRSVPSSGSSVRTGTSRAIPPVSSGSGVVRTTTSSYSGGRSCNASDLSGIVGCAIGLLNKIIPLIITLALVYFLWGVANYIKNSGEDSEREKARLMIVHGLISLFVMISVWGLVNVIGNTFPLNNAPPRTPQFNGGR